jgi:predicted PurR-regulated permease PerM
MSASPRYRTTKTEDRFRKAFLLVIVITVSVAFVVMLQSFLTTILMAAIFSGLVYPLYLRLTETLRGNRPLASGLTLLLVLVVVIVPVLVVLGVVVNQAIRLTGSIGPFIERLLNEPTYLDQQLQRIPGIDRLEPYRGQMLTKAGDIVNSVGGFLIESLSNTTKGTVTFVFHFFILLYTMFFLLMDGPAMLRSIVNHLPLNDDDKQQMTDRFMSVTRATIKGTIIIGIIQGALSGLAFWVVGIPDALFWSVVMAVLSILPVVGGAMVWVPACIFLAATGSIGRALVLAAFCSLVVGSVDNVIRPRLVGRDTEMHDLVILFSTLGGILVFGPIGFILGPVLAGLFITSWHIFAVAYRDALGPEIDPPEPPDTAATS